MELTVIGMLGHSARTWQAPEGIRERHTCAEFHRVAEFVHLRMCESRDMIREAEARVVTKRFTHGIQAFHYITTMC
jgi:hypothetical protein